ncbi:MAG: hypothetical protein KDD64_00025 [Bdellovibrionales bacterium]|nr:hypothetical protein [Bdellovibrionales bacterium]
MTIPLVGQKTIGSSSSPLINSTAGLGGTAGRFSAFRSTLNLSSAGSSEDAIRKSLEEEQPLDEISPEENGPLRVSGYLASALKELSRLAKDLKELEQKKEEGSPEEGLDDKILALQSEVSRIKTSDPFQRALEAGRSIEQSLQRGSVSKRALGSVSSLLGDDYLNLVASGATGAISTIQRKLEDIASSDDPDQLINAGKDILKALAGAKAPTKSEEEKEKESEITLIDVPRYSEQQFAAAGALALSLRTYESRDLLQAVAGGYITDPKHLTELILTPPKEDEEDDAPTKIEQEQARNRSSVEGGSNIAET